jgi:prepilin-type N-terminal cleavage/methylation domain-containing protein
LQACVRRASAQDGFTFIELLLVVIIIGILLTIAVQSISGFRERAADSAAGANIREAVPSIAAYHHDNHTYLGMTPAGLRGTYDSGLSDTIAFHDLTPDSYCVQSTESGRVWHKIGPEGPIEAGAC